MPVVSYSWERDRLSLWKEADVDKLSSSLFAVQLKQSDSHTLMSKFDVHILNH